MFFFLASAAYLSYASGPDENCPDEELEEPLEAVEKTFRLLGEVERRLAGEVERRLAGEVERRLAGEVERRLTG